MSNRCPTKRLRSPHDEDEVPPPKCARYEGGNPRQQSKLLNLILPLEGDPYRVIRTCLMQYLDVKDVLYLCSASRVFRDILKPALFDVNAALKPFFEDPVEFRTQLGRCNALIYGWFPLCFLKRLSVPAWPLDIAVENGNSFTQLEEYIFEIGYRIHEDSQGESHAGSWTQVRRYTNSRANYQDRQIRLLVTRKLPIKAILRAHTSHDINFISWNKAFSIFPRLTFLESEAIPFTPYHNVNAKYLNTVGLRMRSLPPNTEVDRNLLGDIYYHHFENIENRLGRRVGDHNSWVLSLDTTYVVHPATPDFVLEHAAFDIKIPKKRGRSSWYRLYRSFAYMIEVKEFTSPSLRYSYTFGPIWDVLDPMFERSTFNQLCTLNPEEQERVKGELGWPPQGLSDVVFEKPKTWNYLDDQVPKLFEKLLNDPRFMDQFDFSI